MLGKGAEKKPAKSMVFYQTPLPPPKVRFATEAWICPIAAWTSNNLHNPCNTIFWIKNHAFNNKQTVQAV